MKRLFNWIGGFFSSDNNNSSKRLVGIVGAFFLFYTLYTNSQSEVHVAPAESLVYSVTALVAISLGLTTVESISNLFKSARGQKTDDANVNPNEEQNQNNEEPQNNGKREC